MKLNNRDNEVIGNFSKKLASSKNENLEQIRFFKINKHRHIIFTFTEILKLIESRPNVDSVLISI